MNQIESMSVKGKTHRIYLQDTHGNLYPSSFSATYSMQVAFNIANAMNQGYNSQQPERKGGI